MDRWQAVLASTMRPLAFVGCSCTTLGFMNWKLRGLFAVGLTCGTMLALTSCSPKEPLLSADLAFNFSCANLDRSIMERGIEDFLRGQQFKVLNIGSMRREFGFPAPHDDTYLTSIDASKRRIEIQAAPVPPKERNSQRDKYYFVRLNSPPPTQRSPDLEEVLLAFVPGKLSCKVTSVTRGENGTDKQAYDNSEIARIEGLFRQAEMCRNGKETGKTVPGGFCSERRVATQPNSGAQPTQKSSAADAKR